MFAKFLSNLLKSKQEKESMEDEDMIECYVEEGFEMLTKPSK